LTHFDVTLGELARLDWDQIPERHLSEYFPDLPQGFLSVDREATATRYAAFTSKSVSSAGRSTIAS
jgi:hypothetical protein